MKKADISPNAQDYILKLKNNKSKKKRSSKSDKAIKLRVDLLTKIF